MKHLLIAALIGAQLLPCAAPAAAAELAAEPKRTETHMGAFAGARLRVALGGERRERVRAGLTVAPALHGVKDGTVRLRVGEGLEFGLTERRAPALSLAGRRLSELSGSESVPDGNRQNVSTLGWVAIGAGVVAVAGIVFLGWLVHEANENTE